MSGRIVRALLLAAVSVVMLQGTSALADPVVTSLGGGYISAMAVDDAHQHVFLTSENDSSITVVDFSGNVVATIPNIPYGAGMVIHGTTLYVTESVPGTIEAINLSTLADEGPVASGLTNPQQVVYAAGELWTVVSALPGQIPELASVSLAGDVTVFPGVRNVADLQTSPATPDDLYTNQGPGPDFTISTFDVSSGSPVQAANNTQLAVSHIAVSPDGTRLAATGVSADDYTEFSDSSWFPDGVLYPGDTSALATSPGDGGLLATGDLEVFSWGSPIPLFTWPAGNATVLSVALSADGSRLFAATSYNGNYALWTFDLDPKATATALIISPDPPVSGQDVTLTATVVPTDGGGSVDFEVNGQLIGGCAAQPLSVDGTATCTTTALPAGPQEDIAATYSGDAAHSSSTGSVTETVDPPAGTDVTWIASASDSTQYWSTSTNWAQGLVPYLATGTITFPDQVNDSTVDNDISSGVVRAAGLVIDSEGSYDITGSELVLGSGGLMVGGPDENSVPPTLALPLTLSADQTWTIDEGPVPISGIVSAPQYESLTLDFANGEIEPSDLEVGDLTATGQGDIHLDGNMAVNSDSLGPITLDNDAGLEADESGNSVGPVSVGSNGWISVGGFDNGGGALAVDGNLAFAGGSELDLAVDAPGTSAGSDYSQITSTGSIALNGAKLDVGQGTDQNGGCDDLEAGDVLTLLSASGTITGTFSNYANGASVDVENDCDGASQDAAGILRYSAHAVTLTLTAGGTAGAFEDGPVEIRQPSISGNPAVGQTLQVDPGSWEEASSFEYDWYACGPSTCTQINGATGSSFQLTSAQLGYQIVVDVTAVGPGGSNDDTTNFTAAVTLSPVPHVVTAPVISGTTTVGNILTATSGTWSNSPTLYLYQWERCSSTGTGCVVISGATSSTYTLATVDAGSTLEVSVTAKNSAGTGSPSASGATAVISAATTKTTATTVSSATVKSDLKDVLKPKGKTASLQTVLAKHGYAFSFSAPASGKLTVTWVATVKHHTVTIAKATLTISGARTVKVSVRLTSAGTRDLKQYSHLKIKSEAGFTAAGLKQVSESSTFSLAASRSAHASAAGREIQVPRSALSRRS